MRFQSQLGVENDARSDKHRKANSGRIFPSFSIFFHFPPHTILRPSGPDVSVGRFGPAPALPSAAETAWSTTPICHTSIFASQAQQISTRTPRVSFGLIFIRWYLNGQCQSRLAMATAKGSQKIWDLRWPSSHVLWNGSRDGVRRNECLSKFITCMFIYDTYLIVIVDVNCSYFSHCLSVIIAPRTEMNWMHSWIIQDMSFWPVLSRARSSSLVSWAVLPRSSGQSHRHRVQDSAWLRGSGYSPS